MTPFSAGAWSTSARRSSIEPAPPLAITGVCSRSAEREGGLDVDARQHAVAADIGVDDGGDAGVFEAERHVERADAGAFGPAFGGDDAVAGIDADRDPARVGAAGLMDQSGRLDGGAAEDDPVTPASIQRVTPAMSRMPPPSWTGTVAAARMASTAAPLTGRPAKAPLRSTTCSQAQPASCQARAWAPGSSE